MHDLCLEVLTVYDNELRLSGAKAFAHLLLNLLNPLNKSFTLVTNVLVLLKLKSKEWERKGIREIKKIKSYTKKVVKEI